ncbi:MAG: acyl-CoA desaturase [Calditrichaeota bacterium]|nr:MAG: acyl-CoA desaturase [Calditrichota bacterium]
MSKSSDERVNWPASTPFLLIHLGALLVIWAGFSWVALVVLVITYGVRMFAITGGYHRYFSHRSYKTGRVFQFLLGLLGTTAVQKGPLWWAAHHRHHHRHSDQEEDIHSPKQKGFWWAHVGWILCDKYKCAHMKLVHDLQKYPELRFLERYYLIGPALLIGFLAGLGVVLNAYFPQLHTSAFQMIAWGFFLSTTLLYHGTFTVNSLTHMIGRRRFQTSDDSKNSFLISLITLGEGWHNNHHRFPSSERQGFYWWEIDISHYVLRVLSWLGVVWDLRRPPQKVYADSRFLKRPNRKYLEKQK